MMKRILIVSRSTTLHFESGGMESHLKILAEGLAEQGCAVTVLTSALFKDEEVVKKDEQMLISGVNYYFIGETDSGLNPLTPWEKLFIKFKLLPDPYSKRRSNKNFYAESVKVFEELNKADQFDLVISQSTGAYGFFSVINKSLPMIVILHGSIFGELRTRFNSAKSLKNYFRLFVVDAPKWLLEFMFLQGMFLSKASRIIVVSKSLQQSMIDELSRMPNAKNMLNIESTLKVINNGVDSDVFKPQMNKYSEFTCLYIGRIAVEKGVERIVEAAKQLKSDGFAASIKFKIIGTGPDFDKLKLFAKDSGVLNDNVELLGQIKNSDLAEIYAKSHLFVFPTLREEGHPVTFSESMCSGLPYVSTKMGGLADLVVDGVNGYFVENSMDLAQKILMLYKDNKLLDTLSTNSRNMGLELYSKKAMINKYLVQIDEVLQSVQEDFNSETK